VHLLDSHSVVALCLVGYVEQHIYGEFHDLVLSFLRKVGGNLTDKVKVSHVYQLESPL
jgi:hypothetical protein